MINSEVCPFCGGNFEYTNGKWKCRFCGSYRPKEFSDEETVLIYMASQKLRQGDFYEAEQDFDDIIHKYPENSHAYWGRLMSRYGIKYEEDYDGNWIPTCYAASIEGLYSSNDYLMALKYADEENRSFYRSQADYIENVRKEWVERAAKERPYDIFICYKESDRERKLEQTEDSYDLQDIYIRLTEKGYRVFFSRVSLRDKVGEKYEPYIFNALSTAKVMLVYGSRPEYINSAWMKNEWTRYGKRIQTGEKNKRSLLVACKGFSPSELPALLRSRQCFDASRITFCSELFEAVEKIMREEDTACHTSAEAGMDAGKPDLKKTESKGLQYQINRYDEWCLIEGIGTCRDSELIIPKTIFDPVTKREFPVTTIASVAFSGCTHIKSVVLPDTMQGIGDGAFQMCKGLTSVVMTGGFFHIRKGVFSGCERLAHVVLPDGLQSVGAAAFQGCVDLKSVIYTGTVKNWKRVKIASGWRARSSVKTVTCSDGILKLGIFS